MSISARRFQRIHLGASSPLTTYKFGFEAGSNGATVTTGVSAAGDRAWDAIGIGSGAALVYDTTHAMSGSLAARLDPGSSVTTVMRWSTPTTLTGAFRYYVYWDANPTADMTVAWFGSSSSTRVASITVSSAGSMRVYGTPASSVYSTGSSALQLGGWTRIECAYQIDSVTSTNGKIQLAVYAGDSTTPIADSGWVTTDLGTAGITYARVGNYDTNSNTTSHWIDAITFASGATSLLGPEEVSGGSTSPIADAGSLLVGSASYAIPGGAIFMATNGVDTNGGTLGSPVASLTKAVSLVPVGGTIVIRGGSYNDGSDTQSGAYVYGVTIAKNVTIQNYPGEAVWFDGSTPVTGSWTQSGSTWSTPYDRLFNRSPTTVDGAEDGWGAGTGAGGWWTVEERPEACWPDMVFYDGVQLEQVTSLAAVTAGKFFVEGSTTTGKWFQGTTLHIGDNPAGHEVRYANKCKLMTLGGTANTSTIRGIGIRRYASYIVGFGAMYVQHNLTLENVWVEDMRASFMHCDSSDSLNVTKFTARRIGFNCFGSNMADNFLIDRADMRQCNYAKFNLFGPSVATIKFNKCQFMTIKNSIFKDSYSTGFWVDSTGNTPIIYNCLFQNLTNRAIDYETASDGIIANCKFINNGGTTIVINDSDTTRIYNCTFAENNWGYGSLSGSTAISPIGAGQSSRRYDNSAFSFNYDSRLGASYYTDFPQHQWTINYITVCNTVIARPGIHAYDMFAATNNGDSFREAGRTFLANMHPTMNGNVYHWTTQPQYPWICGNGYNVNPIVYFSLSAFKAGTGLDTNSSFTTTDPLDSNYEITNQTYHNNTVTIPADIATLIGHATTDKRVGAFW